MGLKQLLVVCLIAALHLVSVLSDTSSAATEKYDLVYIWDKDLESVLDYKDQVAELFDDGITNRLKIVSKNDEYGVVYDINYSARDIIKEVARHGDILREAGLKEGWAIKDEGYHRLYNVSYGLGPNLDSLKKTYDLLYAYLGKEVGKNLYIEKTSANNYTLIFRKRGSREETYAVALAHAKLLKKKRIRTSITPENNNEIVYGESSLLNEGGEEQSEQAQSVEEPVLAEGPGLGELQQPLTQEVSEEEGIASREQEKVDQPAQVLSIAAGRAKNIFIRNGKEKAASGAPVASLVLSGPSVAPDFERNVEDFIKKLRKTGKIRSDEKTGWMVYDLENDLNLVNINANEVFQAASMIKPFVALAYFHQVKAGKLKYGSQSRRMMEAMIQRSSNSATNWVMRQVGGPSACEKVLRSHYPHIFKRTNIQEYIPAGGRTYRNSAQPSDYIRYLKALWDNELPYTQEMRRIMALPGRDRLYHGTPIPQGTLVYNKTGSTAHLIGDMGILVPKTRSGKRHPYAIVGIIERSSRANNYGSWMMARGNVIREVSTIVYEEMKKKYRLL